MFLLFRVYILPLIIEVIKPVLIFIVQVILDKFTDLSSGCRYRSPLGNRAHKHNTVGAKEKGATPGKR
jgi:hypothetical protein